MKKIISLFQRNYAGDYLVRPDVVPGAEWVLAGEGVPTRKYDGTCCLVRAGVLYKRHEIKPGNAEPIGFEEVDSDSVTGKRVGWVPVGDGPEDRWHREAWGHGYGVADGTYELVGPKIQGNPERFPRHALIRHGWVYAIDVDVFGPVPLDFDGLKSWFQGKDIEGIVWHHPDGRMVKIKGRDFGITRGE